MRWLGCVLFCARTSLVWIFNCASLGLRQPRPGGDTDSLDVLLIPDNGHPSSFMIWWSGHHIPFLTISKWWLCFWLKISLNFKIPNTEVGHVLWVGVQVSSLCKKFWALEHLPSDSLDKETRYNCRTQKHSHQETGKKNWKIFHLIYCAELFNKTFI